jgi:hypothetical protein
LPLYFLVSATDPLGWRSKRKGFSKVGVL